MARSAGSSIIPGIGAVADTAREVAHRLAEKGPRPVVADLVAELRRLMGDERGPEPTDELRVELPRPHVHVLPRDNGWVVSTPGEGQGERRFESKADAVDFARELARKGRGSLILHRTGGVVQQVQTYAF